MQSEQPRKRTIRSYVRRAGRMTPSQLRALDTHWPTYGVEFSPALLEFSIVFGRTAPVVLEIGFGNGESLVQQAFDNPQWNFLGIDVHDPGIGHCILKAEAAGVKNLRLLNHDAIEVLSHQIPDSSLARTNLYFPDPWPKKRHNKRRIVQIDFLETIADRLGEDGTLNIATDWAPYAEHIDEVLSQFPRFECVTRREHDGEQPLDRPRTKFERRGLKKGHRIFDWCYRLALLPT